MIFCLLFRVFRHSYKRPISCVLRLKTLIAIRRSIVWFSAASIGTCTSSSADSAELLLLLLPSLLLLVNERMSRELPPYT